MKTYQEMNEKIVKLLRLDSDNLIDLYAAQRIEELEAELNKATESLKGIVNGTLLVDESQVYGNDCTRGGCDV